MFIEMTWNYKMLYIPYEKPKTLVFDFKKTKVWLPLKGSQEFENEPKTFSHKLICWIFAQSLLPISNAESIFIF